MQAELTTLEDRINALASYCSALRRENQQLQQDLAAARKEGKALNEKINATKLRLDMLIGQLPDEDQKEPVDE